MYRSHNIAMRYPRSWSIATWSCANLCISPSLVRQGSRLENWSGGIWRNGHIIFTYVYIQVYKYVYYYIYIYTHYTIHNSVIKLILDIYTYTSKIKHCRCGVWRIYVYFGWGMNVWIRHYYLSHWHDREEYYDNMNIMWRTVDPEFPWFSGTGLYWTNKYTIPSIPTNGYKWLLCRLDLP